MGAEFVTHLAVFLLGVVVGCAWLNASNGGETLEEQNNAKAGFQVEIDRLKKLGKPTGG